MDIVQLVVSLLAGLATAIPLVVALIKYVSTAVKEGNWSELLSTILDLVEQAEEKFDNGTDRKDWVLVMIKASAESINYDIDYDQVSELIDSLVTMSKIVNPPASEEDSEES